MARSAKPIVEYDGTVYKVRSANTVIPELLEMDRIEALIWLNRNTYGKGRSNQKPNLLAGLGDAISLGVR